MLRNTAKKITAVLGAVLLGVGISVVSIAAPASAHTPDVTVNCDTVSYKFTSYGSNSSNTLAIYVGNDPPNDASLWNSLTMVSQTLIHPS